MTEQEKSRIILEWAGFTKDGGCWLDPEGCVIGTVKMLSLYALTNLWILFEYVIPKFKGWTIHKMEDGRIEAQVLATDVRVNGTKWLQYSFEGWAGSVSEALCEAILKALEASREP